MLDEIKKVAYGEYYIDIEKGGLVYASNNDFLEISGYTKQDIESQKLSFLSFVPPEYRDEYAKIVFDSFKTSSCAYVQHPFLRKNKTVIYVLCFGQILQDGGNTKGRVIITDYMEHFELLSKYNSSQLELDSLTSTVPGGILILKVGDKLLEIYKKNDEFCRLFNVDENEDVQLDKCMSQNDYELLYKKIKISIQENSPLNFEFKLQNKDKSYKWLRVYGNMYKYSYGQPLFYVVMMDITKDIRLNNQLLIQAEKFRMIAENTDELYFDYDVHDDRMSFNNQLSRYCLDDDNSVGDYWGEECAKEFIHPKDYENYKAKWKEIIERPSRGNLEFRTKAFDDNYTWYKMIYVSLADEQNKVSKAFGKLISIQHLKTLKKKIDKDSEYINYLLETDNLTGLYNRKTFKKKAEALICSMDTNYVYGVVYSDINDFSYVNENFGYESGNKMLKDFAKILTETPTNLVGCRIYSDFFVGLYRAKSREELFKSIEERNSKFTSLQKKKYPASDIRVSCGIYVVADNHTDITYAIDNANLARRSVKDNSSIICGIYSQRMRTQRAYEQSIANELHSAIENRQIEMFLQPKFNMKTREIIGAEALARWRNVDGTYKMPIEFIPVLEKVGYIDELDFFIYDEALRTLEKWKKDGVEVIPISVNFSQHHVSHPRFVEMLLEAADKYDVEKSNIEIEITESCFSGDMQILFDDMGRLRAKGFKVSIDDFGIGYSTLSVLMKAPVDIVKVDKSFIDNLTRSKTDREFVKNMCKLIDTVSKDVIFEGVETEEQAEILSQSGYTKAQGWLFDKAMPLEKFNKKYLYGDQ